jgi:protoporphyrinogen oxidase
MTHRCYILGAGVTGLGAARVSGLTVYEAQTSPGGICASYYAKQGSTLTTAEQSDTANCYRFEIGGGHWIFGGDPAVIMLLRSLAVMRSYERQAAIFFPKWKLLVPYPLQYHLRYLEQEIGCKALNEVVNTRSSTVRTLAEWLEQSFGPTLTELFFGPFHKLYTAGLWDRIAPQDGYKTPVDCNLVIKGALGQVEQSGYNTSFLYPEAGLDALCSRLAEGSHIEYGYRVVRVDVKRKELEFANGRGVFYDTLISTLPLNQMINLAGLDVAEEPDPYTSVLVLNIGARRGTQCPNAHWVYVPTSHSGFHRIGFYSNVDPAFLPTPTDGRVSLYVERAFQNGDRPSAAEVDTYVKSVIQELREWEFIDEVEVVSPTWIDIAYTWSLPGSQWRKTALTLFARNDILMVGRYGRWHFQGIADSIRDGLVVGASIS